MRLRPSEANAMVVWKRDINSDVGVNPTVNHKDKELIQENFSLIESKIIQKSYKESFWNTLL